MNNRYGVIFSLMFGLLVLTSSLSAQNFWQSTAIPGLAKAVNVIAVDGSNYVYAGTNGKGLFRSTDNGTTWLRIDKSATDSISYVYALGVHGSTIWAGTYGGVVRRSTNSGTSWTSYTLDATLGSIITSVTFIDTVNVLVGSAVSGVFVSSKNATTWTQIIPDTSNNGSTVNIFSMISDSHGLLYLGTYGDGAYRSTNSGNSWGPDSGLAGKRVNSFALNPLGGLFAATDFGVYKDTLLVDSLFKSDGSFLRLDSARSWVNVQDTLISHGDSLLNLNFASSIVSTPSGHLIVGTEGYGTTAAARGVFRSTDLGKSWQQVNTGMGNLVVRTVALDSTGYVYCGTLNGTVFRSTQPEEMGAIAPPKQKIIPASPKAYVLEQNYPNPFNPSTNIPFSMPVNGHASIKIYNTLGQEVATVLDQEMPAGQHTVRWDASAVPSGMYFYRFQSSNFSQAGKLILMK